MNYLAVDLRLGAANSEPVPDVRREFHAWLASALTSCPSSAASDCSPARTAYLRQHDIHAQASVAYLLLNKLVWASAPTRLDCLLVDLSANPYGILRDIVLLHIATALEVLSTTRAVRTIALVLPALPPDTSLLWDRLRGMQHATAYVFSPSSTYRAFGPVSRVSPPREHEFCAMYARTTGDVRSALKLKVVRRLGHFRRAGPGRPRCSQHFFDAELAKNELRALFRDRLGQLQAAGSISAPSALLLHAPMSPWLSEVGLLLASELHVPVLDISVSVDREALSGKRSPVLLVDLVDTGSTLQHAIEQLASADCLPQQTVLSAMTTGRSPPLNTRTWTGSIDAVLSVDLATVPEAECPQCRLQLPFTDPAGDAHFGIRAYDMWTMLQQVKWGPERDVPRGDPAVGECPDAEDLCARFGDFLAYKVEQRLRALRLTNEVAIVCPEEPGAQAILSRLRSRFENRLTAIEVPRPILNRVPKEGPPDREFLDMVSANPNWGKPLSQLRGYRPGVVLLDEFNASGGTARAMKRLMDILGIPACVYLPIINRVPGIRSVGGVPVASLYELDSPR